MQQREEHELFFTTQEGTTLFYRHRPALQADESVPRRAVVMFHRGHEHSARMMFLADELGLPDFDFFAWDARGHGLSPGERGDSPSVATSVADIHDFIQYIQQNHQIAIENTVVIAQSVGAVLVSAWLHDYAPPIRGAVLASPAFKVKLYVPFARQGLRLMQKLRGNFFVQSYVKPQYLTHDIERIKTYRADSLIARAISVRILLGLYEAGKRVIQDAQAIITPIQLLISGSDWVVHQAPQHEFYNRLGSHVKERHILKNYFHDTLGEYPRDEVLTKMRQFIRRQFEHPPLVVDRSQQHLFGFSRQEADGLATPLPLTSAKGAYWAIQRAGIRWGSRLSQGLQLGVQTGFDSGSTLDYVYQNTPQAVSQNTLMAALGRVIDRQYLNAIGWRGIRQRKIHLQLLIQKAMTLLRDGGHPIHVLDVAAGHGRYLLDALIGQELPASICLRDYSDINVAAGRALIAERGLGERVQFIKADAFDRDSYRQHSPNKTLGVVSGCYELFADNDLIMRSLHGFADVIDQGGYLIYTNQPWHPQLEMIARCLTSHREYQDWVMRRRSQAEMDQLVAAAGFVKIDQRIDVDGIFTVSLAVKRDSKLCQTA